MHIDDMLRKMVEINASDLHLKVGEPPVMRIHGKMKRMTQWPVLTPESNKELIYAILNDERRARFEETHELDLAHSVPGVARFRVNVFQQRNVIGAVLRLIPIKVLTIEDLKLPEVTKELADKPRGLVLVTGPTGSGKSTSLAAMIDYINDRKRGHVLTIEDPVEFVHADKKCVVNQRELGVDTHSFADALKHALRQNPDVILVGEMRDLETISLAITAAETGHLVFGTLHTTDAAQTIDRVIDVFPPEQQEQVRAQLAITLQGVISQTLLPRKTGGRVAAFEIMVATPAIRSLIREGKTHQMYSIIQTGGSYGMISLDQYLRDLVVNGVIEAENALAKSSNPAEFVHLLRQATGGLAIGAK